MARAELTTAPVPSASNRAGQVTGRSALRAVARDKEGHSAQALTQARPLLGVRPSYHGADRPVSSRPHRLPAPRVDQFRDSGVDRFPGVEQHILYLRRAWVRGLHQDVQAFACIPAPAEEGLQPIAPEVRVDRDGVGAGHVEMGPGIGLRGAADVAPLDVGDDDIAEAFCQTDHLLIQSVAPCSKGLEVGDLDLHGGRFSHEGRQQLRQEVAIAGDLHLRFVGIPFPRMGGEQLRG